MKIISMKKVGFWLLVCCVICLIIGIILLPKKKLLVVDVEGIVRAVVWLVAGYIAGQAGLLLFVSGMNRERVCYIETLLDERLPKPQSPARDPAAIPPCDPSLLED